MRIVLLGCPGAGKGTQAKILAGAFDLAHISTGDIFRAEIAKQTPLGVKVQDYVKKGMLVPDAMVVEMVAAKLDSLPGGWLLDGFPRTLQQAQELDKYLEVNGQKIDVVLYLAVSEAEVIARLASRWSCPKCGEVYNLGTSKPKVDGKCDKCGDALTQREDDQEWTARKRLLVYSHQTEPLTAYYRTQHDFHEVNGGLEQKEVTAGLIRLVEMKSGGVS